MIVRRLGQRGAREQKPGKRRRNEQFGHAPSFQNPAKITRNNGARFHLRARAPMVAAAFFRGFWMPSLAIRPAKPGDTSLILMLLTGLADYEELPITLTEKDIAADFFGPRPVIECDLAFEDQTPVGITTYFWTYATFRATRRLYVEDLFVLPAFRGKGHGKALLRHLARHGVAAGAGRLEWQVLDWNAPAMRFYESIGAHKTPWLNFWLEGEAMQRLAVA
jgi:GNAT superfamily N-acetyltransferase